MIARSNAAAANATGAAIHSTRPSAACRCVAPAWATANSHIASAQTAARARRLALAARKPLTVLPAPFVRRDKLRYGATRFHSGISRDIQAKLTTSKRGNVVTDFVDRHRSELQSGAAP